MLCFRPASIDVYSNLATEEYLLKHSNDDFFMLWQSENAIVVGKNQDVDTEADRTYANNKNIRIARRFSGGGAVYQDLGNFNLTFIETTDKIDFNRYIHRVIDFLSTIGIEAQPDERLGITVGGLKISGSAQCVHKNRVMYHCTLLYSTDLDILNNSLNGKGSATTLPGTKNVRAVPSVRSQVTNLNSIIPDPTSTEGFGKLILTHFLSEQKGNSLHQFTPEEYTKILQLQKNKYECCEWIFERKSPL